MFAPPEHVKKDNSSNNNKCARQPAGSTAGYSAQSPPPWWMENTKYDCPEKRGTERMHNCAITEPPTTKPTPGKFYQTKPGDTLISIVEDALAPTPVPDPASLGQVINEDPCNVKFHELNVSVPLGENPWQIAITPRFAESPEEQAESPRGGRGAGYPVIRIPPAHWRSGFADASGFAVSPRTGSQVSSNCGEFELAGCRRDFQPLVDRAWRAASDWVEKAYHGFPQPGTLPVLSAEQAKSLDVNFGLKPSDFRVAGNRSVILELRSKWAALNAMFENRSPDIDCARTGTPNCDDITVAQAVSGGLVICEHGLALDGKNLLPQTLIHENAHHLNIGSEGFDVYRWHHAQGFSDHYSYRNLTPAQQSVNMDSYGHHAASFGPEFTPGGLPPCLPKEPSHSQVAGISRPSSQKKDGAG